MLLIANEVIFDGVPLQYTNGSYSKTNIVPSIILFFLSSIVWVYFVKNLVWYGKNAESKPPFPTSMCSGVS